MGSWRRNSNHPGLPTSRASRPPQHGGGRHDHLALERADVLRGAVRVVLHDPRGQSAAVGPEDRRLNVPFSSLNTAILVLSSLTCQSASSRPSAARSAEGPCSTSAGGACAWFILTYIMGAVFIGGQALEYAALIHEGVTIPSGLRLDVLPGHRFHGLHVTGGPDRLPLRARTHLPGPRTSPTSGPSTAIVDVLLLALRRRGADRSVLTIYIIKYSTDRNGKDFIVRILNPHRSVASPARRGPRPVSPSCCWACSSAASTPPSPRPRPAARAEKTDQVARAGALPGQLHVLPRQEQRGRRNRARQLPARPVAGRRRCRRRRLPGRHRPDADGPARARRPPAGRLRRRDRREPSRRTSPRWRRARPSPTSRFHRRSLAEREEPCSAVPSIFLTTALPPTSTARIRPCPAAARRPARHRASTSTRRC